MPATVATDSQAPLPPANARAQSNPIHARLLVRPSPPPPAPSATVNESSAVRISRIIVIPPPPPQPAPLTPDCEATTDDRDTEPPSDDRGTDVPSGPHTERPSATRTTTHD
jgi:hypothetical protein